MARRDSSQGEREHGPAGSSQKPGAFTVSRTMLLVGALVGVGLVYFMATYLTPIILSMIIAFVLDPFCDWLEEKGLPRSLAAFITLGGFVMVVLVAILTLLPFLIRESIAFITGVPDYLQALIGKTSELARERFGIDIMQDMRVPSAPAEQAIGWLTAMLGQVISSGMALVRVAAEFGIMIVVIFFLLRDFHILVERLDASLPRRYRAVIRQLARDSYETVAGFVRGQGLVCILLGMFYAAGLWLIGLEFGILVGLSAGLISFIPYVGSTMGIIVATAMAIVQFDSTLLTLAVPALFLLGQAIEGNLLVPVIVGHRVRLHPVWVITALYIGGVLFGFAGLMLSLPLAAAVGVIARYLMEQYRQSAFFSEE